MGSLVTALASFCDIKQRGGLWYVRIDDIDPQRFDPNGLKHIQQAMTVHGLSGDGPLRLQSANASIYEAAKNTLSQDCYFCDCSRRQLKSSSIYPGRCRHKTDYAPDHAIRIAVDHEQREFNDACQGPHRFTPSEDFGDFIIWRRDQLVSYHLATACDDGSDYSHILRGVDLFDSTPPQLYLMEKLGLTPPTYAHIPMLTYADGAKLSKQTQAPALNNETPEANLRAALKFLGQDPPKAPKTVTQWLEWAVTNWRFNAIPRRLAPFVNDRIS